MSFLASYNIGWRACICTQLLTTVTGIQGKDPAKKPTNLKKQDTAPSHEPVKEHNENCCPSEGKDHVTYRVHLIFIPPL